MENEPVSNTLYRVGTPPVRPLPLENRYFDSEKSFDYNMIQTMKERTLEILTEHGITRPPPRIYIDDSSLDAAWLPDEEDGDHIDFVARSVPGDPTTERFTVLVTAEWDEASSPTTWQSAALQIKTTTNSLLKSREISVEIIDYRSVYQRYIGPILDEPALEESWDGILANIVASMDTWKETVVLIGACRLGVDPNVATNNPITVYIALSYDCPETEWANISRKLREDVLDKLPFTLDVWIEHNTLQPLAFDLVPPSQPKPVDTDQTYRTVVNLGAALSSKCYNKHIDGDTYNPMIGTLGCYVEIKTSYQPDWKTFALTNYHVIRPLMDGYVIEGQGQKRLPAIPAAGTLLRQIDRQGITPDMARTLGHLEMEHPPRQTHNAVVAALDNRITRAEREGSVEKLESLKRNRDTKTKFFDDNQHVLGRVFAASGHCRTSSQGHRMDWALIEVAAHRQGTNRLPEQENWERLSLEDENIPEVHPGRCLQDCRPESALATMAKGSRVWKMGAITGPTFGVYDGFRVHHGLAGHSKYLELPASNEHKFVPSAGPRSNLAGPGDSGAVAYDRDGHAMALIFRGIEAAGTKAQGFTIVTPIEDVFNDIKDLTGAVDVRVAQS